MHTGHIGRKKHRALGSLSSRKWARGNSLSREWAGRAIPCPG